jgi:2-(1,2-epoxy-1,2-dihydrophenyl)acetyl-CoA isomerase
MSTPTVEVETRGAVAIITLNRPGNGNAISLQVAMDLLAAALTCSRNPAVRAVVLTGAGQNFCFGGDLRAAMNKADNAGAYLQELTTYLHGAISHFVRMNPPVIAAVNGTAAGAGMGLVLMADLAVSAAGAKFNMAYTAVGLTPDGGTSFLLPRAVGSRRAMEMILLNRALTAQEALDWGLVNQVVPVAELLPDAEVLPKSLEIAERLASSATRAFGRTKRLVAESLGALERQMVLESETIVAQAGSTEGLEGVTAFLEKRKPSFTG